MALTATGRDRVEEAVKTLARYNKDPFITDFLKKQPKPRIPPSKFDKDDLCETIKLVLLGEYSGKKKYVLSLNDLVAYLDQLQETGRQHLYLFSLPEEGREEMLARLRNPDEVKALFGGEDDIYAEGGRLVWEARGAPQLALVRHEPPGAAPPARLVLKWVETRAFSYWEKQQPAGAPGAGGAGEEEGPEPEDFEEAEEEAEGQQAQSQTKKLVTGEERAATFFFIDLENGDCELRIQALRGLARAARLQQLATYRALAARLLGLEPVGPTVLAPAVRRSLLSHEVQIVRCVAILPSGGQFIGKRGELPPVDVRKLEAGVAIRFVWPESSGGRVELDGRLDEILIHRPLLPEQHRALLERVRRWRREGLALFTSSAEALAVGGGAQPGGGVAHTPAGRRRRKESLLTLLRVALVGGLRIELPSSPGVDRATREYAQTHAVEEQGGAPVVVAAEGAEDLPSPAAFAGNERPLRQFLSYIKEVAQSETATYQREIELVRSEEHWNFFLSIIAAILALAVVTTAAVLLLFYSAKLLGTITTLLGVLTGRGTLLIRSYAKSLKAKREMIQDRQRDSQQTLLAIQTALSIPDDKARSRAMAKLASTLVARGAGPAPAPKQSPSPKQSGAAIGV